MIRSLWNRCVFQSVFITAAVSLLLVFSQRVIAECDPASNPDLNNDGIVSTVDLYTVTSKYGLNSIDPDFDETADTNCDGTVNTIDIVYVQVAMGKTFPVGPTIELDIGQGNRVLTENTSVNVSYTASFTATDIANYNVEFSQTITPDNSGIGINTDAPSSWTTNQTIDWIVNGTLTGSTPGVYTLTTTALIVETGATISEDTNVEVLPEDQQNVFLSAPSADPDGIPMNQATTVIFSAQVDSDQAVADLNLQEVDNNGQLVGVLGTMLDDGQGSDFNAGDRIFSGSFSLPALAEGNKFYRVTATVNGKTITSDSTSVPVTRFPTTLAPSDPAMVIDSDDPLVKIFSDHIVVAFVENTSPDQIESIVAQEVGTIIGSISSENIFQIGFDTPKTFSEIQSIIDAYKVHPEVEFAETSVLTTLNSVYPDDKKGAQKNMEVARVDEVWLLAPAGGTVAIVDTGVDYNHSDLNVIKGKDFVSNDTDPMDASGHGTRVAGVAAATINNNVDVAGVSNSKVLAVRGIGSSNLALANAIKYAAGKANVVNVSAGSYSSSNTYENVTKKLGGKIITSTAGNDGLEKKRYPCANTNVLCVGNSTDGDGKASTSNFGSWVDIAAPGENVISTQLGGGTATRSGTSYSAPLVAGAAQVIWNQHSGWSASKVKQRLLDAAKDLPASLKIGDRLDLFEAFFNGGFELDMAEWDIVGTCSIKTKLGPILPTNGKKMVFCTTGPAGDQVAATLSKTLNFVADSDFTIKFDYNFVSEEYPEFVGSIFDDSLKIKLVAPDGSETILAEESINTSSFSPVGGIDFPGGDDTVGQTGWKSVSKTIAVTKGAGSYRIVIEDAGDDIYDSAVLLDNIKLK